MIRFVDINTGNTFDGRHPYVFWFDGAQSTGLIYSQKICFISHDEFVDVRINKNDIFHLIDSSKINNVSQTIMCNVPYLNIHELKTQSIISKGTAYHNYWVHMIYLMGTAEQAGEYLENIYIDDEQYTVGADFYDIDESLYINLSNNGVEIPNSIQKAIYDGDIREDRRDNILLNRKWKELLSNLWDTVANRGSYKSLFNSLKWFEYGDLLRLREIWKREDGRHFMRDLQSVLSGKYFETLLGSAKTTYLSLSLALNVPIPDEYDDEKNPALQYISSKWASEELSLKMSLLGNFFKTYFMPIHLDLIHSTIEDVVYTNTFKVFNTPILNRTDFLYDVKNMRCNIKDAQVFKLGQVKAFVGPQTLFGSQYGIDFDSYENLKIVGVQKYPPLGTMDDNDKKTYTAQLFNDIGVVVDVELNLEEFEDDIVKREMLIIYGPNEEPITRTNYKVITSSTVNFSILCQKVGQYTLVIKLDTTNGFSYHKTFKFSVIDTTEIPVKIYKIHNDRSEIYGIKANDFMNKIQKNSVGFQKQYIPAVINYTDRKKKSTGVRLNHLLIMDDFSTDKNAICIQTHLDNRYDFVTVRGGKNVYVSKNFDEYPEFHYPKMYSFMKKYIYKEDQIYMPERHIMVELGEERYGREQSMDYYIVTDSDALCVVPELSHGLEISEPEWEFKNMSTGETISLKSIREPFVANTEKKPLTPGYYNIVFRYKLDDKINEVTLESAFLKR